LDRVLVVFDRFGQEVADGFVDAAIALGRELTAVYVPLAVQERTHSLDGWTALRSVIHASTALVNILTDGSTSTGFRAAVLSEAAGRGLRTVHMPGVSEDMFVLSVTGVNFAELHRDASQMAAALSAGSSATIHTVSSATGQEHVLSVSLEGRQGHADGGIVRPGEIINIPTGEAYIATCEDASSGSIVINGSFPECDLSSGSEVVLVFEAGRLQYERCVFPLDSAGLHCRNTIQEAMRADPEGVRIGELGIGLNPTLSTVAGTTILDEKVRGTAHVAIGANHPFGGVSVAPYHHDLVFFPTRMALDGQPLGVRWGPKAAEPVPPADQLRRRVRGHRR
jgi:leucyl aminopeptidase (aminopeptidase T)